MNLDIERVFDRIRREVEKEMEEEKKKVKPERREWGEQTMKDWAARTSQWQAERAKDWGKPDRAGDSFRDALKQEMERRKNEPLPTLKDWGNPPFPWKADPPPPAVPEVKIEYPPPPPVPVPEVKIEYPVSGFAPDWVRMDPERRRVPPWMEGRVTFRPHFGSP
jgi:hypothetical protein